MNRVEAGTRISEAFASYRRDVIHKEAGPTQVKECRRAFYAGAFAALQVMLTVETGPPGVPMTEAEQIAGAEIFEALKLEIELYVATTAT